MTRDDSPAPPDWVVSSTLDRTSWTRDGRRVRLGGLLVLATDAPSTVAPRLVLDGSPVPTRWGLRSPKAATKFPGAANADSARFRSAPLPARGGRLQLTVTDPETGTRVLAERSLPSGPRRSAAEVVPEVLGRLRLRALPQGEERDPREYDELHSALWSIRPRDRDLAWLEASVLMDATFRRVPRGAFRRLGILRARRLEADERPAFDAFYAELTAAVAPYTLSSHGYVLSLKARDESAVWRDLSTITARISALGYDCFVNSGTLLGLVRDGGLIDHDDDTDLAVLLHGKTLPDLAKEWLALRRNLAEIGLMNTSFEQRRKLLMCKLGIAGGVDVDLFPAWLAGDRLNIWPYSFGVVARDDVLPLERRTIAGSTVPVPRRPEVLLEANYGPGWRTPDPTFHFRWDSYAQEFAEFRRLVDDLWE